MEHKTTGKNPAFLKSALVAARGLATVFKHERKIRLAFLVALICAALAVWVGASSLEILLILFAWTQVIVGEIINTALEKAMDYSSGKEFHPLIQRGKDYAAASVFVLSVFASASSCFILGIRFFSP